MERVVAEQLDERRLSGLLRIGVDEVSYRKGHRYLSVVADRAVRVVWAAEGKNALEETASDLMVKCSRQTSRGTSSQQRLRLLTRPAGARSAARPQEWRTRRVLTCLPLPEQSLSNRLVEAIRTGWPQRMLHGHGHTWICFGF